MAAADEINPRKPPRPLSDPRAAKPELAENVGRGSWIRTNDLQYPKQVVPVDKAATTGQLD